MHFIYFAEKKLEFFYDFLVERTEENTTKVVLKEAEGKAAIRSKGTLGSILSKLGLARWNWKQIFQHPANSPSLKKSYLYLCHRRS
jgi:hypothetical protein